MSDDLEAMEAILPKGWHMLDDIDWQNMQFPPQRRLTLDPQALVCDTFPEEAKLEPIKNDRFWKPRFGGLWTSTLHDEGGDWLRWLIGENYSLEDEKWGGKLWKLTAREANLYTVWGPGELHALVERFPHPELDSFNESLIAAGLDGYLWPDWERVAEHYDGFWVPNPWPWRFGIRDHGASMFFYSMDAECTCWFRWCFDEVEELDPEPFVAKLKERWED